jgi:hypothetical protein
MRIAHGDLEACLRNPQQWFSSMSSTSHPYKMGYDRALLLSIFHYHKTSAIEARNYLSAIIQRHNFNNASRVMRIEADLEEYIRWGVAQNLRTAAVQMKIQLLSGFLELRGEVARLDVTTLGYRAVLLKEPPSGWRTQLRMPLIQLAVSGTYARPAGEIEVGFQRLDGSGLETACYSAREIRSAVARFGILGRQIRRLSQSGP